MGPSFPRTQPEVPLSWLPGGGPSLTLSTCFWKFSCFNFYWMKRWMEHLTEDIWCFDQQPGISCSGKASRKSLSSSEKEKQLGFQGPANFGRFHISRWFCNFACQPEQVQEGEAAGREDGRQRGLWPLEGLQNHLLLSHLSSANSICHARKPCSGVGPSPRLAGSIIAFEVSCERSGVCTAACTRGVLSSPLRALVPAALATWQRPG